MCYSSSALDAWRLDSCRAQPSVRRWANEVAARGSFVARCPEAQAAVNPGALPVPVLVVANKADLRGALPNPIP